MVADIIKKLQAVWHQNPRDEIPNRNENRVKIKRFQAIHRPGSHCEIFEADHHYQY